ncbi:hypothetical protein C4556_03095 [Candidatus Parcubacteria bacterium]|nr:MAG: hypothetical protein C4556_03095 [Candidatus Parcubacteria bacterium]
MHLISRLRSDEMKINFHFGSSLAAITFASPAFSLIKYLRKERRLAAMCKTEFLVSGITSLDEAGFQ